MANFYIYATDDSGSTHNDEFYNTKGLNNLKIFKEKLNEIQAKARGDQKKDKVVYLHWSHRCKQVNEDTVINRYTKQSGRGHDTLPHTVLDWMQSNLNKNDTIKLLYVVTDGAVAEENVTRCDHNMTIENVMFYAYNSNVDDIDLSVASKFICNNKSYRVYCNDKLIDKADLLNPFDYGQITIETFDGKKEELKSYIKLKFLNEIPSSQESLDEIEKLKQLRVRLFKELNLTYVRSEGPINLNVKEKEVFISEFKRTKFYRTLLNRKLYYQQQKIEEYISTLINYINNDSKSFQFDNLNFVQSESDDEEEDMMNIKHENMEEIAFPDISLPDETRIPVIMLTQYDLFQKVLFNNQPVKIEATSKEIKRSITCTGKLQAAHFSRFRKTLDCPLFLMYDYSFKDSIEGNTNLKAFKSLKSQGKKTVPRARRPFTSGIVPLEEFDDYNDYVLACTYFDGKDVSYNKGLMYYVIWKTCQKLMYIKPGVSKYLKDYVEKRIAKSKCFLALSSVSVNDPLIRVDLTTALWYCVEMSSIIFKDDAEHFTKEKMRIYCNVAKYMKEILSWFQYNIDKREVTLRTNIFKYVNRLKRVL